MATPTLPRRFHWAFSLALCLLSLSLAPNVAHASGDIELRAERDRLDEVLRQDPGSARDLLERAKIHEALGDSMAEPEALRSARHLP